jgi:hypothetical protein
VFELAGERTSGYSDSYFHEVAVSRSELARSALRTS